MSKAKEKFDKTIARCNDMVHLYTHLKENGEAASQDILRGAIVLSVAAFDAYATDCFSEHFINYIKKYNIDNSIITLLTDAGFDVRFALDLIKTDRPYRKIRTIIDKHYSKYTTQRIKVIDDLFQLYHIDKITKNAAKKAGKKPETFLKSVERLVERRHCIVHDGDYNDHNRITNVTSTDIKRIETLKVLVDNMEEIINNRFSRSR